MCRADGIQYRLWQDGDAQALSMINRSALDAATTMAQKADILRLEILYQFGGIYLDTDVEPVKSVAPLYSFSSSMLVCHENDK
jgi:mannosyltransferase OCH1-like enzyme